MALISKGLPTFTPLIWITLPTQVMAEDCTILCPLMLMASAPEFFSSFTMALKSESWIISLLAVRILPPVLSFMVIGINLF